jgi:hypothetical protein
MVDKSSKIVRWVLYALMAISVVFSVLFYAGAINSGSIIQWGYILMIATVIIAVISPIYGFIQSPGNLMKILISVGLVAVVAIVSYAFAGNSFSALKLETLNITAQTSTYVGMGLLFTYITAAIAIIAVVFSSFFKIFK